MASDLKTHPDTENPALNGLVMIGMMYATDGDKAAVQHWIERFRSGWPKRIRPGARAIVGRRGLNHRARLCGQGVRVYAINGRCNGLFR